MCCDVLQCVVMCYDVLRCIAMCCDVMCCEVLRCIVCVLTRMCAVHFNKTKAKAVSTDGKTANLYWARSWSENRQKTG